MEIQKYWRDVLHQDAKALKGYFAENASIRWHNTNEQFTVDEFIKANCEYPGAWNGEIQRIEVIADTTIAVVHVWSEDRSMSFHVVSFIKVEYEKITAIDEYWGDDGTAPQWRLDKKIGIPIVE